MKASELNYDVVEHCDVCNKDRLGTMHHAAGATGFICPVLWTCHYCSNPPRVIAAYRSIKGRVRRFAGKVRYYATTTADERAKRREHFAKAKARINARRVARGEAPIA